MFHLFDIDAAFFLSSAGFIGAGLAIGGQHKVNDYLTGLSVLFEDRYGVGDELLVEIAERRARSTPSSTTSASSRPACATPRARCTSRTPSWSWSAT